MWSIAKAKGALEHGTVGGQEQERPRQPKSMTDLEFECLIYIMEHGLEMEL